MSWIALGTAAVGAAGSIYSANKQAKGAKDAAQSTIPRPYAGVSSPFGYSGFDPTTRQVDLQAAPNPFMNLFGSLGLSSLANAGAANSSPFNGANPELVGAYGDANSGMDSSFGGLFNAMQTANSSYGPSSQSAQDYFTQMQQLSAPEENRQRVGLDDQLFARGQLGSTGGAERYRALMEAQGQNANQRRYDAIGMSNNDANSRFANTALTANFGQQTANQRFANALSTVNQGINSQQQQFNMGTTANNSVQNMFQQLLNQAGINVSAGGGVAPQAAAYQASQAGNVGNAVAQIANSQGAQNGLAALFNRGGGVPQSQYTTPGSTNAAPYYISNAPGQNYLPGQYAL